jgi:predicted nucleotidyltransferase component of viral defense system
MEYYMMLHQNKKLFSNTIRAASQHLNIKQEFVEKDYWITLVLSRLAQSPYASKAVFKGGTSLSKGYQLIDRFSEDVDLAIINNQHRSGNEVKTIIRNIEKEITRDLKEMPAEGITSKGSHFRKSVFAYSSTGKTHANSKIIVEINSFANPFPIKECLISSFVFDFLIQTGNENYISVHNLQPFEVFVLNKEQTLLEKMASLVRFSFEKNPTESISGKIRHFYDLHFLLEDSDCRAFVVSKEFKAQFEQLLQHDKAIFDQPIGWQNKDIVQSPLLLDFENLWKHLRVKYQTELSVLAYRSIPNERKVANSFLFITNRIV